MLNEHRNSLIKYDYKKSSFYFYSKYGNSSEIKINLFKLEFNETLSKNICDVLKNSFEQSKKIAPNEPSGPFEEPKIYSEIINYVNFCSYKENEPDSILEFTANLFYKYLTGHKMVNGNKRLSLLFLINLLRVFGYHFFWSKGLKKDYKKHEKDLEEWVKKSHNLNNDTRPWFLQQLTNWIKSNCVIALEWR